ncbi:MAG: beta strand repeat-containing protein, partial [Planctomycetota bacterium]
FNTQAIVGWIDPSKTYSAPVVTAINKKPSHQTDAQKVFVKADMLSQHSRLAGVFNLQLNPNLELNKNSMGKMVQASPTGADSKKGGAGGVVSVIIGDNNTEALIMPSVDMRTGSSGLYLHSDTRLFDMIMAGAGAKAGKFGFSGTAIYTQFNNKTVSNIASGMTYAGGIVDIDATDLSVVISMAGSLIRGSSQGFGVSLAINDLTRNTEASIGERNGTTRTSTMNIAGPLSVYARNKGSMVGAAIAAAVMSAQPPATPAGGAGSSGNPSSGGQGVGGSGGQGGASSQAAASGQSGIGISGAVVLNGYGDFSSPAGVSDNARAFVRTQGAISATSSVTLEAVNNMTVAGLSGSAAVNTDPTKRNTGIAGALSINTLGGTTEAYLGQVQLTAPSLGMISSGKGIIVSLAAGVATAPGADSGTAVSGSVSANNSTMNTLADIGEGAVLSLSGNASLASATNSLIVSVAGAVSYGGKKGIGAAIAVNKVKDKTRASVGGSTINFSTGGLSLSATSDNPGDGRARIVSLAGAVGLSTTGNSASGLLAVNQIENTTEAYISASTLGGLTGSSTGTGISLTAYDDSTIISIGAAIAIGKDTSGGAGIGYADIRNTTRSYLSGVTIGSAGLRYTGGLTVSARSRNLIVGIAVGGAGAAQGSAYAGNVSTNVIINTTEAYATNSTWYGTTDASFTATDESTIGGAAGSIAISTKGTAVGAAATANVITNTVRAYVEGSRVDTSSGKVTVSADAPTLVVGIAVGGSGSSTGSAGAGSPAINLIRNTVLAEIRALGATRSQVLAGGDIIVSASDKARIIGVTGSLALSGTGTAVGVALATNDILNKTTGRISNSTVTSSSGAVSVTAGFDSAPGATAPSNLEANGASVAIELPTRDDAKLNEAQIVSVSIGVAGSGSGNAIGGSLPVNVNKSEITAEIVSGSTVSADKSISVMAQDQTTIGIGAGGIGIGAKGGGGALTANVITNIVKARIDGSTANSTAGSIVVQASGQANIKGIALGVGGG